MYELKDEWQESVSVYVLSLGEQNCSGKPSRARARRIESTRDWTDG